MLDNNFKKILKEIILLILFYSRTLKNHIDMQVSSYIIGIFKSNNLIIPTSETELLNYAVSIKKVPGKKVLII